MAALERLEDLRQEMIAKLDGEDGDPDLEPNGDLEPSIEPGVWASTLARNVDLEGDDCDAEPDYDEEPSLGWPMLHAGGDQRRCEYGAGADLELDDSDREPDCDGEPEDGQ